MFGPRSAYTQQPASPRRVGVLLVTFSQKSDEAQAFRRGLRDAGYSEGADVVIEWRSAEGDYDRLPQLATDLVQRKVEVIVTDVTVGVQAVLRTTSTIPIVMAIVADPLGSGLVSNLARPEANITGLSVMLGELTAKRLELLKEALPRAKQVVIVWNPGTPYHTRAVADIKAAAQAMSIEPTFEAVRGPKDFSSVSSAVKRSNAQAILVIDAPVITINRRDLLALAAQLRIPLVCGNKEFVPDGALLSYGADYSELFRRAAGYVDKIHRRDHVEGTVALVALVLIIVPLWRICGRAGFNPALSLLAIIPFLGFLIVAAILAFAEWPASKGSAQV